MHAKGADILTGGAFGPEGGLGCTMILLLGIGIVAMRTHRSGKDRLTATDQSGAG
jgi:hypothetical protein